MRPLLVVVLAVVILGGMQVFMHSQQRPLGHAQPGALVLQASGEFSVEVRLTFDAGPDEFSLDTGDAPSLLVRLGSDELYRSSETLPGDTPVVVTDVQGIAVGNNYFYVEASAQDQQAVHRAVQLRVLRGDTLLGQTTLLADPGTMVQGALVVDVAE